MVYSSKFVICLLINGKIQKDRKNGTVVIPFGSEYAIRLRNKHKRRAVAKIYIDGENVSGGGYVVPANDYVDIERHNNKDRAFKFVDLDSEEAYDAGKNGDNDDKEKGTIEVHFFLEEERQWDYVQPVIPVIPVTPVKPPYNPSPWYKQQPWYTDGTWNTCDHSVESPVNYGGGTMSSNMPSSSNMSLNADSMECSASTFKSATRRGMSHSVPPAPSENLEDGCTVEGNNTGQKFTSTWINTESHAVILKLFLQGYQTDDPVYVHEKKKTEIKYCENCGAKRKGKKAKFCSNCGHKF